MNSEVRGAYACTRLYAQDSKTPEHGQRGCGAQHATVDATAHCPSMIKTPNILEKSRKDMPTPKESLIRRNMGRKRGEPSRARRHERRMGEERREVQRKTEETNETGRSKTASSHWDHNPWMQDGLRRAEG